MIQRELYQMENWIGDYHTIKLGLFTKLMIEFGYATKEDS